MVRDSLRQPRARRTAAVVVAILSVTTSFAAAEPREKRDSYRSADSGDTEESRDEKRDDSRESKRDKKRDAKSDAEAAKRDAKAAKEAARLLGLGNEHFAASRWDDAVATYRQSLALAPSSKTRVNLAVAIWRGGDAETAASELDTIVSDPETTSDVKAAARSQLDELLREVARIDVRATGRGRVVIDGVPMGDAPLTRRLYVAPGKHTVTIGTTRDTFSVLAGEARIVDIAPRAAVSVAMPKEALASRPAWRWVLPSAVGAVGLTVGTIYGLRVQSAENEIADLNATSSEHDYALARALEDRGRSDATISNIAFVVGAATAVTAIYIFITDRTAEPRVGIGFNGASAWATGTF